MNKYLIYLSLQTEIIGYILTLLISYLLQWPTSEVTVLQKKP